MRKHFFPQYFAIPLVFVFFLSGCATTRPAKAKALKPADQIAQLQQELQNKDQEIAQLEQELQYQRSAAYPAEKRSRSSSSQNSIIKVSGVTAIQLQKALKNAGYSPGALDGRIGQQTKNAIKLFQKQNGLKADGIVGQRTWSLLKSKTR